MRVLYNIRALHRMAAGGQRVRRGAAMRDTDVLDHAWIALEGDRIHSLGSMAEFPEALAAAAECTDCTGRLVLPGFVDSHTHIVFARSRADEFVMRIQGRTYEEIAAAGGGILNSARRLQAMDEDALYEGARARALEILSYGTTTVEIKSGYGLTLADELKMLRVARRVGRETPLTVRTTFLGAHAIPTDYKGRREDYIRLILEEMLPAVAAGSLADYIDVFCDEGFFTVAETERILEAGARYGLRAKIHANELANSGGVQAGVAHQALSVDHLERIEAPEIECLLQSETMPVALPGCSFFLGIPYAPARQMIDAGLPLALATDFNPGSSPGGSLPFVMALACTRMKMLPEEALNAVTLNAAAAMGLADRGALAPGLRADLVLTHPLDSLAEIPYFYARNPVARVMTGGEWAV